MLESGNATVYNNHSYSEKKICEISVSTINPFDIWI